MQEATLSLAKQRFLAKKHLVVLMQSGSSWQDASKQAGVQISRSSAYRLLQAVRLRGDEALQDGRHGHPAKLREPVVTFVEATVKSTPEMPSREVQTALSQQFGITVSVGHINRIRAQKRLGSRDARRKKNRSPSIQLSNAQNSMAQGPCCFSQPPSKRSWSLC